MRSIRHTLISAAVIANRGHIARGVTVRAVSGHSDRAVRSVVYMYRDMGSPLCKEQEQERSRSDTPRAKVLSNAGRAHDLDYNEPRIRAASGADMDERSRRTQG